MKEFFHSARFKILVCVAALLIGVMLYAGVQRGKEAGASFFQTLFSPLQDFSTTLSNWASEKLGVLANAKQYSEDNEKLKQKLDEMTLQMVDYDKLQRENAELRELIGLKEDSPDFELSPPCDIISRTTNDPFGSFVIDRGSDDGISQYDPVITSSGLVGIVRNVSKTYSRVQTILDPNVPVGAYCVRTKDTGVVEGAASYAADGLCVMRYLDRTSEIEEGDIIVSSGNSGLFPIDQVIGRVEAVEVEESGLSLRAVVRPVVDVNSVSSVVVITSFNGQGETYAE